MIETTEQFVEKWETLLTKNDAIVVHEDDVCVFYPRILELLEDNAEFRQDFDDGGIRLLNPTYKKQEGVRKLQSLTDKEAIHIANIALGYNEKSGLIVKPKVHRLEDDGCDIVIVTENFEGDLANTHELTKRNIEWIEIDDGLTVRERHNTLCDGMLIYEYLKEIGF